MYQLLSEKFLDAILEAKEGEKVPNAQARAILFYMQRDQLASRAGLANLLEALAKINLPKAQSILDEAGVEGIKLEL